jgi:chemotaxis protein CheD
MLLMRQKWPRKRARMKKVIDVHIGEVKIARKGELLKAILGSCVGIGIIWKERRICGLAHCLLPENPNPSYELGGRFVDQAMKSLLMLMRIKPDDYSKIEVVIVGGGNMTSPNAKDESHLVGSLNYKVAMNEAKKLGLNIVFSEGGGKQGRKISLDASNYTYKIEVIPRILGKVA